MILQTCKPTYKNIYKTTENNACANIYKLTKTHLKTYRNTKKWTTYKNTKHIQTHFKTYRDTLNIKTHTKTYSTHM